MWQTSPFPTPDNSKIYYATNEYEVDKMKDKTKGVPIPESYELNVRMYSFINEDHKGDKSAKGINRDGNKMNHKEHIYIRFSKGNE